MKTKNIACIWSAALLIAVSAGSGLADTRITPEIRAAADQGDPAAQYQMSRAFATGRGAPRDAERAWNMMKAAAEAGHPDAIGGLGFFYATGIHVEKDDVKALEAFRRGAELGSPTSQLNLARCLLREKTLEGVPNPPADPDAAARMHEEGVEWLRKAAASKLPAAAAALGRYHYFGEYGVTQDYKEAARWLLVAAEDGDADSQNLLAVIHEQALLGSRDEEQALRWYRQAALQNNVRAQANLGQALGAGSADKKRRIEAIAWLMISEQAGDITAKKALDDARPAIAADELDASTAEARRIRLEISKSRSLLSR
jgi:TPR repeat protein